MERDYKFVYREFDKFIRILEAEGKYPPSVQDIELFCMSQLLSDSGTIWPVGTGIPSQMIQGISTLDRLTSERILDITDGINNQDLFVEMRDLLVARAKEITES